MNDDLRGSVEEVLKGDLSELSEAEVQEVRSIGEGKDTITLPDELTQEREALDEAIKEQDADGDIRNLIGKMKLPQKVKLAMFGNAVARGLLIRDANKLVQLFVLKNPKITLKEIEDFSKNPNLSEHVLRAIAAVQGWIKSYTVKLHLVTNPKTPGDISLKWIRFLNATDVKKVAKSKNVPQIVMVAARKRVAELDER